MIQNISISTITIYASSFSIIIPFLVGVFFFRKQQIDQRVMFWYVVAATLTEAISLPLAHRSINNLPGFHLFTVVEFGFLTKYFQVILKEVKKELPANFIIAGFLIFSIINVLFFEDLFTFNSNGRTLESLILILLSVYYLYILSASDSILHITEFPAFWGATAILIYFAGTIFVFAFTRFVIENLPELHPFTWIIHSCFNIIFNSLLAKTLWKVKERSGSEMSTAFGGMTAKTSKRLGELL